MTSPIRHLKALVTAILAVFAIAATIAPTPNPVTNPSSASQQKITLEMIRKVAIVSRELL
jgi:hypothetical protein